MGVFKLANYYSSKYDNALIKISFFSWIALTQAVNSVTCFSNSISFALLFNLAALVFANIILSSNSKAEQSFTSLLSLKDTRLIKKLKIPGVSKKLIYFEAFIF